ncbi:MAG: acyltransferase family protein [Bacillota bacterium]
MNQRSNAVDIAKFLFALGIIGSHLYFYLFPQETSWLTELVFRSFMRVTPTFFTITSYYFLFRRMRQVNCKISDQESGKMISGYLVRIIGMYAIWSAPYLLISTVNLFRNGLIETIMPTLIWQFLYSGTFYHMWFFTAVIWGIVLFWFLARKLPMKVLAIIACVLWAIGVLIGEFPNAFQNVRVLGDFINVYTFIFQTPNNGLFYGLPLAVLTYHMANREESSSTGRLCLLAMAFLALYLVEATVTYRHGWTQETGSNIAFFMLPAGYFITRLLLRIHVPFKKANLWMRKCSILLYTLHPLLIVFLIKLSRIDAFSALHTSVIFIVVTISVSLLASFLIVWLSRFRTFKWMSILY